METDMAYQPYYLAYSKANGRSPDEQMAHDEKAYPGGVMAGFILWMSGQQVAFKKAHPEHFIHGGIYNFAAWGDWLAKATGGAL